MNKQDKMVGCESTHLDYVHHLIYPDFHASIAGFPPPPIDGIVCLGVGSKKVFIYVTNEFVAEEVQSKLDEKYQEEKKFIEIKITGAVSPAFGGVSSEEFEEHLWQTNLPDSDPRKRD